MIKFNEECREAIIKGVNIAADAIGNTFGPNGTNVIIRTGADIHLTKDGATVADAVKQDDPYIGIGIELIRRISRQTADTVGDGSTTSALLAREIVNAYKDNKNPIDLSRKLVADCAEIVNWLDARKKVCTSKEDILKVATLSANNDPVIGELVATAYDKVGKDGLVLFTESEDVNDRVEYTEGFRIDNGFSSSYFVNTPEGNCELENVMVYISDSKMEEVKDLAKIADVAMRAKKSLLVMAPGFDSELLVFLNINKELLKACTVISPNHRMYREIMLNDIKTILGDSMCCDKVILTKNNTTFLGCHNDKDKIQSKITEIQERMKNTSAETEINFLKKRFANFTSGIATIKVGGYSRVEVKERMDRVEDAVKAAAAAYTGLLPGGGQALMHASLSLDNKLTSIIKTPYTLLKTNNENPALGDFWTGFNWKTGECGNLYEMGVIEPFLVTKIALENAVNTASLILTCNCAILSFGNYDE